MAVFGEILPLRFCRNPRSAAEDVLEASAYLQCSLKEWLFPCSASHLLSAPPWPCSHPLALPPTPPNAAAPPPVTPPGNRNSPPRRGARGSVRPPSRP